MLHFAHFNFNVLSLERSLAFYEKALDLKKLHGFRIPDTGDIVYVGNEGERFELELTQLDGRTEPYDLGECEFHLAFATDRYEEYHRRHAEMGCICLENPEVGVYFIEDPDGYWIEIVPEKG